MVKDIFEDGVGRRVRVDIDRAVNISSLVRLPEWPKAWRRLTIATPGFGLLSFWYGLPDGPEVSSFLHYQWLPSSPWSMAAAFRSHSASGG